MGTGSAREPSEAEERRRMLDCLRMVQALLDLVRFLQGQLSSRIAACEELQAELAALQAALRAGPGSGAGR